MSLDHRFILAGKEWTLTTPRLDPFLSEANDVHSAIDMVCACVTEPEQLRGRLYDPEVYITLDQLHAVIDWLIEVICERDSDHAAMVWGWSRSNRILIEGRLALAAQTIENLTARSFYAVAYTLMIEEAGSRQNLERQLDDWVIQAKMMTSAKLASGKPADPEWDKADRLAMSLLAEN